MRLAGSSYWNRASSGAVIPPALGRLAHRRPTSPAYLTHKWGLVSGSLVMEPRLSGASTPPALGHLAHRRPTSPAYLTHKWCLVSRSLMMEPRLTGTSTPPAILPHLFLLGLISLWLFCFPMRVHTVLDQLGLAPSAYHLLVRIHGHREEVRWLSGKDRDYRQ